MGRNQKVIKVVKISGKYDILTVEEKEVVLIEDTKKIILEMTPRKRELEAIWLKASKMQIKERIEKLK